MFVHCSALYLQKVLLLAKMQVSLRQEPISDLGRSFHYRLLRRFEMETKGPTTSCPCSLARAAEWKPTERR